MEEKTPSMPPQMNEKHFAAYHHRASPQSGAGLCLFRLSMLGCVSIAAAPTYLSDATRASFRGCGDLRPPYAAQADL